MCIIYIAKKKNQLLIKLKTIFLYLYTIKWLKIRKGVVATKRWQVKMQKWVLKLTDYGKFKNKVKITLL